MPKSRGRATYHTMPSFERRSERTVRTWKTGTWIDVCRRVLIESSGVWLEPLFVSARLACRRSRPRPVTDAFRLLLGAGYRQPDKMYVDHWHRGLTPRTLSPGIHHCHWDG